MSTNGNGSAPPAESLVATRIAASLTANDLKASLRFYTSGLGFRIEDQTEVEGQVVFAMLKAGNGWIALGQDDFAKGRDRTKGVGMRLWISTAQDIEALALRARGAGLEIFGPEPLPWGPLAFEVTDPDGLKITVVQDV